MTGYLIAETNEVGNIEWVWVHRRGQRSPKPVDKAKLSLSDLDGFEIHGASRKELADWLHEDRGLRA